MKTFAVGSKVAWASQAHASEVEKHGVVVAVVPEGYDVRAIARSYAAASVQFDGDLPRNHESYLVLVKTGKDGRGKPKLYWPRVSALDED